MKKAAAGGCAVLLVLGSCAAPVAQPGVTATDTALAIDLGEFAVDPGNTLTCFSTGFITEREYAIGSALGVQAAGGHHITVYWTTDTTTFAPRPCRDEDMISWNFIAGVGGEPGAGDDQSPPAGLAFRVPAGVHLVAQAHYINTTGAPQRVHDSVDIDLVSPANLVAYAAMLAVNDGSFTVPPRTRFRRVSECTMTAPRSLVLLLGHQHEFGEHFSVELVPADGSPPRMLYDYVWEASYASHPPVLRWAIDAPLAIAPGDRLRTTCDWNNTSVDPLLFPDEMCATVSYYYPDTGEGFIACDPAVVTSQPL